MSAMKRLAMAQGISFNSRAEDEALDNQFEPLHGERPAFVEPKVPLVSDLQTIPVPLDWARTVRVWEALKSMLILTGHFHQDALTPHGWVVREAAIRALTGVDPVVAKALSCYHPVRGHDVVDPRD